MAWTEAARKASAEARRNKAKTRGGRVAYSDRAFGAFPTPNRGFGLWSFGISSAGAGASHRVAFSGKYSETKAKAMALGKRVSARSKRWVMVTKLP